MAGGDKIGILSTNLAARAAPLAISISVYHLAFNVHMYATVSKEKGNQNLFSAVQCTMNSTGFKGQGHGKNLQTRKGVNLAKHCHLIQLVSPVSAVITIHNHNHNEVFV